MKNLGPTENIGSLFTSRNAKPLDQVLGEIELIGSIPDFQPGALIPPEERLGRTPDVLADALRADDLVDCISTIVTALGITNTNAVYESFTVGDRETFGKLPNAYQRATFIASWLGRELQAAAERIHGFPIERTTQR